MLRVLIVLVSLGAHTIRAMCRRRADLVIENVALRQQVAALKKEQPRPPSTTRTAHSGSRSAKLVFADLATDRYGFIVAFRVLPSRR